MKKHWFIPDLNNKHERAKKFYEYCLVCKHHITSNIHFTTYDKDLPKEPKDTEDLSRQG